MTYEEEQAFLKRHIEAAQTGEFVTVNQLFEAYQKEIGRTFTLHETRNTYPWWNTY